MSSSYFRTNLFVTYGCTRRRTQLLADTDSEPADMCLLYYTAGGSVSSRGTAGACERRHNGHFRRARMSWRKRHAVWTYLASRQWPTYAVRHALRTTPSHSPSRHSKNLDVTWRHRVPLASSAHAPYHAASRRRTLRPRCATSTISRSISSFWIL